MAALYPVVLTLPAVGRQLKGRDKVVYLSGYARRAAAMSAERTGITGMRLEKGADGVPLPSSGWHWSISHKPDYVAGVVAPVPVGIDVEKIRSYKPGLERKVASPAEWDLGVPGRALFFRYWTAKEAVSKAVGVGLKGLSRCRVVAVADEARLTIEGFGRRWEIEQVYFDDHIAAMVTAGHEIDWRIELGTAR